MRIQYCSDLHLEFPENWKFLTRGPLLPVGDILILAGDIMLLNQLASGVYDAFIDWVSEHYRMTYWIPGNHEFYGADLGDYATPLYMKVRENVVLLNNWVVYEEGVRIIFSTLWGRISAARAEAIQHSVSDFYVIRDGGLRLTPERFTEMHEGSMAFLEGVMGLPPAAMAQGIEGDGGMGSDGGIAADGGFSPAVKPQREGMGEGDGGIDGGMGIDGGIAADGGLTAAKLRGEDLGEGRMRTMVVTHHVPTLMHYPPKYLKGMLLEAFARELAPFIERWGPDYWIYGHHHINTPPFTIGRTTMLTNQLGYVRHYEHSLFRRDAWIEV